MTTTTNQASTVTAASPAPTTTATTAAAAAETSAAGPTVVAPTPMPDVTASTTGAEAPSDAPAAREAVAEVNLADLAHTCCNPANCAVVHSLSTMLAGFAGWKPASEPPEYNVGLQHEVGGAGTEADDSGRCAKASPATAGSTTKKLGGWTPRASTLQVIRLMQKGMSNDEITVRKDIQVENNAANLRKIRQRAREHGLLEAPRTDKRDRP